MHEWESLSHVRWECKYHVVIIPKYRRKVLLREAEATDRRDPAGVVPADGGGTAGRALHAGPHPHVPEHPAQVQRGPHDRVSEGQECGADSPGAAARAADDRAALSGPAGYCVSTVGLDEAEGSRSTSASRRNWSRAKASSI